jgi:hypothetical protein
MLMLTASQQDFDKLLASLTGDNWFELLPIIHDATYEAHGWKPSQDVKWLIDNNKRPHLRYDQYYVFFETYTSRGKPESEIQSGFAARLTRIWPQSANIAEILRGFIFVWLEGWRPE